MPSCYLNLDLEERRDLTALRAKPTMMMARQPTKAEVNRHNLLRVNHTSSLKGNDGQVSAHAAGDHDEELDANGARLMSKKTVQRICRERGSPSTPAVMTTLYLHGCCFKAIQGLDEFVSVRVVHLENNCLRSCEGLSHMACLKVLYLQQNDISRLPPGALSSCPQLSMLNISSNPLHRLESGSLPASLLTLHAARTGISDPGSMEVLAADCPNLQVLDLQQNAELASPDALSTLCGLRPLRVLYLGGSPITRTPNYRRMLVSRLPQLSYLDDGPVDECERRGAEAWARGGREAEQAARMAYRDEKRRALRRTSVSFAVERARRRALRELGVAGVQGAAATGLLGADTEEVVRRLVDEPAIAAVGCVLGAGGWEDALPAVPFTRALATAHVRAMAAAAPAAPVRVLGVVGFGVGAADPAVTRGAAAVAGPHASGLGDTADAGTPDGSRMWVDGTGGICDDCVEAEPESGVEGDGGQLVGLAGTNGSSAACECAVCAEDLAEGQPVVWLSCHHLFHAPCIRRWCAGGAGGGPTCPLCRAPILPMLSAAASAAGGGAPGLAGPARMSGDGSAASQTALVRTSSTHAAAAAAAPTVAGAGLYAAGARPARELVMAEASLQLAVSNRILAVADHTSGHQLLPVVEVLLPADTCMTDAGETTGDGGYSHTFGNGADSLDVLPPSPSPSPSIPSSPGGGDTGDPRSSEDARSMPRPSSVPSPPAPSAARSSGTSPNNSRRGAGEQQPWRPGAQGAASSLASTSTRGILASMLACAGASALPPTGAPVLTPGAVLLPSAAAARAGEGSGVHALSMPAAPAAVGGAGTGGGGQRAAGDGAGQGGDDCAGCAGRGTDRRPPQRKAAHQQGCVEGREEQNQAAAAPVHQPQEGHQGGGSSAGSGSIGGTGASGGSTHAWLQELYRKNLGTRDAGPSLVEWDRIKAQRSQGASRAEDLAGLGQGQEVRGDVGGDGGDDSVGSGKEGCGAETVQIGVGGGRRPVGAKHSMVQQQVRATTDVGKGVTSCATSGSGSSESDIESDAAVPHVSPCAPTAPGAHATTGVAVQPGVAAAPAASLAGGRSPSLTTTVTPTVSYVTGASPSGPLQLKAGVADAQPAQGTSTQSVMQAVKSVMASRGQQGGGGATPNTLGAGLNLNPLPASRASSSGVGLSVVLPPTSPSVPATAVRGTAQATPAHTIKLPGGDGEGAGVAYDETMHDEVAWDLYGSLTRVTAAVPYL